MLIIPVSVPWRMVPELHTVLVPPVEAIGLVISPEPAAGQDMQTQTHPKLLQHARELQNGGYKKK